jgi:hypothetical protein
MRLIAAAMCLLASSASAADDVHLLSPFEGRFVGGVFEADAGVLWRSRPARPLQIDLKQGADGLLLIWSMGDRRWLADITGTVDGRFAYRPLDADELNLDAHCHIVGLKPAPKFGVRLSLSCHAHRSASPFTIDIDALLDPETKRLNNRLDVALSLYEAGGRSASRTLSGSVGRAAVP